MWIVKGLSSVPNDSKCRSDVGRLWRVHELHWIAINRVAKELCIDAWDSSFDIKLTDVSCLYDRMTNDVHSNFHGSLNASWNENLRAQVCHIDGRTESGARSIWRSHSIHSIHHDVVSTIFRRVMCASMRVHTPIAWKERRHTSSTWKMSRAIEECEVGEDEIGATGSANTQAGCEVIWKCGKWEEKENLWVARTGN